MLTYIFQALHTFRKVFSRRATWLTCCIVARGFLAATPIDGVASLCRFCHLQCQLHCRRRRWNDDAGLHLIVV